MPTEEFYAKINPEIGFSDIYGYFRGQIIQENMALRVVKGLPIIPLDQIFYTARLYSAYKVTGLSVNGTLCENTRATMGADEDYLLERIEKAEVGVMTTAYKFKETLKYEETLATMTEVQILEAPKFEEVDLHYIGADLVLTLGFDK